MNKKIIMMLAVAVVVSIIFLNANLKTTSYEATVWIGKASMGSSELNPSNKWIVYGDGTRYDTVSLETVRSFLGNEAVDACVRAAMNLSYSFMGLRGTNAYSNISIFSIYALDTQNHTECKIIIDGIEHNSNGYSFISIGTGSHSIKITKSGYFDTSTRNLTIYKGRVFIEAYLVPYHLTANAGGPYYGNVGDEIQFYGSAYGSEPPYSYHWDFGDGTTSTEQNPVHTYTKAGNYTVTLTVTDAYGNTAIDTTIASIGGGTPPYSPIQPDTSSSIYLIIPIIGMLAVGVVVARKMYYKHI